MSANAADADRGVTIQVEQCVAERSWRPTWNRSTPILAGIIFVGLFIGVTFYFGQTSLYPTLSAVPQFGLFVALMAALTGLAGASPLYTIIWLAALTKITANLTWHSWVRLSLPVLALVALIFIPDLRRGLDLASVFHVDLGVVRPGNAKVPVL